MTPSELASALDVLHQTDLSPQQFLFLHEADRCSPTMTDLSKVSGRTTAAATGIVARLVKSELVERSHPKGDRRKIEISITKSGRSVMALLEGRLALL